MKAEQAIKPTEEQLSTGTYQEEATGPALGAPKRHRNTSTSELDRLLYAGQLEPDEHCTLNNFAGELYKSGLVFSTRSSMEPSSTAGSAAFLADTLYARTKRVGDQMEALKTELGPKGSNLIVSMLVSDYKISPSLVVVVKKAAQVLRPMYGG